MERLFSILDEGGRSPAPAAQAGKAGADSPIVTQCPESEQRTCKSVKGHILPWENSQILILCFTASPLKVVSTAVFVSSFDSFHVAIEFYYSISEKQSVC